MHVTIGSGLYNIFCSLSHHEHITRAPASAVYQRLDACCDADIAKCTSYSETTKMWFGSDSEKTLFGAEPESGLLDPKKIRRFDNSGDLTPADLDYKMVQS